MKKVNNKTFISGQLDTPVTSPYEVATVVPPRRVTRFRIGAFRHLTAPSVTTVS